MRIILWIASVSVTSLAGRPVILNVLPDSDGNGYADDLYDYIIVGGGGVGCIVARTLADEGYRTLLIERGGLPSDEHKNRQGITRALLGPGVQSIVTSSGVRSHIGATLGGGTAVNYGVWISETHDYYEAWREETRLGDKLNPLFNQLEEATQWTMNELHMQPESSAAKYMEEDPYLMNYTDEFMNLMNLEFGSYKGWQAQIQFDAFWKPANLLSEETQERRSSADIALDASEYLTILLNSNAMTVDWKDGNDANCVVYRTTTNVDLMPLGALTNYTKDHYGLDGLFWNRNLRRNFQASLFEDPIDDPRGSLYPYRVCLTSNPNSRIIIAAGAIQSPLLAMRSGIGPPEELAKMPSVRSVVYNEWVGKRLQDRPMLPLSFFLDGWEPSYRDIGHLRTAALKVAWNNDDQSVSYFPLEEITGSTVLQASLIAARVMFPVKMRSGVWAELGHYLMKRCVLDDQLEVMGNVFPILPKNGLKEDVVTHACRLFSPQARCFKNAIAWITFVSDVRSRGRIVLDPMMSEHPIIQIDYLTDEKDKQALINNVRTLILLLREASQRMEGLMLSANDDWCPARVFDSELTLLDSITQMSLHQMKISQAKHFVPAVEAIPQYIKRRKESSVPVASFPQIWPDPDDDAALDEFVTSYFTSMWHFIGSMSLGYVVDEKMDVYGTRRLSIIDSSVLPMMPRMNPSATLLSLGRAAAMLKVLQRH